MRRQLFLYRNTCRDNHLKTANLCIHVKPLPARDVLTDIATAMGDGRKTGLRENKLADDCSEFFWDIPETIGEGCISAITFPTGFSLYRYDCRFKGDLKISFNTGKVQPLKFIFCNRGHISHSLADQGDKRVISPYRNIIVAGGRDGSHNIYFEAGKRTGLTSLEIDRPKFKRFHAFSDDGLTARLLPVLDDTASDRGFSVTMAAIA